MSSFTVEQYNALCAALAEGARRVKYQDKEVEYHSLSEMLKLKGVMEADLGIGAGSDDSLGRRRSVGVFGNGL